MIRPLLALLLAVALAFPAGAQTRVVPPRGDLPRFSYAPVVKKSAPAVVNVFSRRVVKTQSPAFDDPFFRRFFGEDSPFGTSRERVQNSLGSGVIVDESGLIVTNYHVTSQAEEIRVVLNDRREFEARIVLADEHTDITVLRIDAHGLKLPALEFGDSDGLEVGDVVLAIGNPFGVGQTVTVGIVSALARAIGASDYRSFIQTDAAINPGNSGGALVDLDGRLVGINTAIFSRSGGSMGLGFAVPSTMVRVVLEAARHDGRVMRPWFGASGQAVTADLAEELRLPHPTGVLLKEVTADSPAATAGLKVGDVILAVDGHVVEDPDALKFRVGTLTLDRPAEIAYWRAGEKRSAAIALKALPDTPPRAISELQGRHPLAGAKVGNLNPAFDDELGLEPTQHGVVVASVAPTSPAQRLGLEPGDILTSLNRRPVETVAQLQQVIDGATAPWTVAIRRKGKQLTVTVQ